MLFQHIETNEFVVIILIKYIITSVILCFSFTGKVQPDAWGQTRRKTLFKDSWIQSLAWNWWISSWSVNIVLWVCVCNVTCNAIRTDDLSSNRALAISSSIERSSQQTAHEGRTRHTSQKVRSPPRKIFAPWKNVLDIV